MQCGRRGEALIRGRGCRWVGKRGDAIDRIRRRDAKAICDRAPAGAARERDLHAHALARPEGTVGDEARAVVLRVGAQPAAVRAAARTLHADGGDVRGGRAEEADLRVRIGRVGVRRRRGSQRRAREQSTVRQRARQACRRGTARHSRRAGAREAAAAREHRRDRAPGEDRQERHDVALLPHAWQSMVADSSRSGAAGIC